MAKNIEKIRKEKGVSLVDMADLINVKYQTIRDKIDGKTDFKFGEALEIRNKFFNEYDVVFLFSEAQ